MPRVLLLAVSLAALSSVIQAALTLQRSSLCDTVSSCSGSTITSASLSSLLEDAKDTCTNYVGLLTSQCRALMEFLYALIADDNSGDKCFTDDDRDKLVEAIVAMYPEDIAVTLSAPILALPIPTLPPSRRMVVNDRRVDRKGKAKLEGVAGRTGGCNCPSSDPGTTWYPPCCTATCAQYGDPQTYQTEHYNCCSANQAVLGSNWEHYCYYYPE